MRLTVHHVAVPLALSGALALGPGGTLPSSELGWEAGCAKCATVVTNPGPNATYKHKFDGSGNLYYCEDCHPGELGMACSAAHTTSTCGSEPECEEGMPCEPGGIEELTQLAVAAGRDGRVNDLLPLVADPRLRLEVNSERRALQIVDCAGDHVLAHVPIGANRVTIGDE